MRMIWQTWLLASSLQLPSSQGTRFRGWWVVFPEPFLSVFLLLVDRSFTLRYAHRYMIRHVRSDNMALVANSQTIASAGVFWDWRSG
jgi:hypothetical protein